MSLRVTAWILRFVNILKKIQSCSGPITAMELQKARMLWDLYIQYKKCSDILCGSKNNNLQNQLSLQQDTNGLLQCQGRFGNATSLNQLVKCPKLPVWVVILLGHQFILAKGKITCYCICI